MDIKHTLQTIAKKMYNKELKACDNQEVYYVLLAYIKDKMKDVPQVTGKKKLYYISAEFLIGKLLSNNLINLKIYDEVRDALKEEGFSLAEIEECEKEPSLGNGGLGRLAACFIDSIATLDLLGDGVGLNYHLGLFKQEFKNNKQYEVPNPWIEDISWEEKSDKSYTVDFKDFSVKASLYKMDVLGYNGKKNYLNLFDVDTVDDAIVEKGIDFDKENVKQNLTLFLYPDDSDEEGKRLRLYQQYFLVSSAAQMILDEVKEKGQDIKKLHEHVVIQINDTHPSLVIPELIRLLINEGFTLKDAVKEVTLTCAYTNHTILAEALEKWPQKYIMDICPQLYPIILALDAIANERSKTQGTAIIDKNGLVHMAHMDIHFSMSTNGVAAIHTDILKNEELNEFYELYPVKFNNKTNGITFRRWLLSCNHELTTFLDKHIGEGYKKDATELEKLLVFKDDKAVKEELLAIKDKKKSDLKEFLMNHQGADIDVNSVFDIQIKRLHEYKRQQMNVLYLIHKYLEIKKGNVPVCPVTAIFGAKAAPAYIIAKDIINVILSLSKIINEDPEVSKYLKVVMVENYNVTAAEKLIPACDISEQISLASKEASGTGNMKFMLNGAVTLGTDDGANVEIHELVGDENIYIFGASSDEVISHYKNGTYSSKEIYENDEEIKEVVDFLLSDELKEYADEESLNRLFKELTTKDWFMTLLDFKDYVAKKDEAIADYEDRDAWATKMIVNIAKAGFFSSDRTIDEYNKDIWKLK